MTRRHRTVAAVFALLALVFAQFAVSAHSCPLHRKAGEALVMAHHEGCGGAMDQVDASGNDNICEGHCQYGSASVDNAQPDAAAVDVAGPPLRMDPVVTASGVARTAWRFVPAAARPPPAILFGVLRI
jgi:hypothetical protein